MSEINWETLQEGFDRIKWRMDSERVSQASVINANKNLCGRKIQSLRKKLHLTQDDVAAIFSVDFGLDSFDQSTLARVENGKRFIRDYELLIIATILSVSIEDLLAGGSEEENVPQHGNISYF